jgi:hypothetical protein
LQFESVAKASQRLKAFWVFFFPLEKDEGKKPRLLKVLRAFLAASLPFLFIFPKCRE